MTIKKQIHKTINAFMGFRAPHPKEIQLEITNLCPLRCVTCGRKQFLSKFGSMNFVSFCKLMDLFNLKKIRRFHFGGYGEPLLNDEIIKMIESLPKKIYKTTNTNLFIENRSLLESLSSSGIDEINISLDGFDKFTYEKIRIGSSWERVVNNIKFLSENKPSGQVLNVHSVVFNENKGSYIDNINKLLSEINVDSVRFVGMKSHGVNNAVEENKSFFCSDQISFLKKCSKAFETEIHINENKPLISCFRPFREMYILFDGNVTPCCNIVDNQYYNFGNLIEADNIEDVWNSKLAKRFRKDLINDMPHRLCGVMCGLK